jgi:hypothetical protein
LRRRFLLLRDHHLLLEARAPNLDGHALVDAGISDLVFLVAPDWVSISAALVPISEAAVVCELPDMPLQPCYLFADGAQHLLSNDEQVHSLLPASPARPPWPRSSAVALTRSLRIAAALFSQMPAPLPYSEPDPGSALLAAAGKLLLLASNMWETHDLRTSES